MRRHSRLQTEAGVDWITVEEPMELRIRGRACATLMRTPGDDRRLALGFFFTEGWIAHLGQVGALALCGRGSPAGEENIVDLIPADGADVRSPASEARHGPAMSSCGVCGKRTIEEVLALSPLAPAGPPIVSSEVSRLVVNRHVLLAMPERLRASQRLFASTGGLHAAGIFDADGNLLVLAEDIGRHNAVDKVIGWALESNLLPLRRHVLFVSGRVSFEIAQKTFRAGMSVLAAVSGVSSLAVDLAERAGITLLGFVRGETLSVYTHPQRLEH